MKQALRFDFVRFSIVGLLGFLINLALLSLFYKVLGWPLLIAQMIAAEVALAHNFLWHHYWTYQNSKVHKTLGALAIQFHATSWVAIVGSGLLMSALVETAKIEYLTSLVITAAAAMVWNFGWTKFVIWQHRNDHSSNKSNEQTE